ncbi:hypothetical protein ACI65C_013435 [Semiaphis heraclei]
MADQDVSDMLTAWVLENYINIFKGQNLKLIWKSEPSTSNSSDYSLQYCEEPTTSAVAEKHCDLLNYLKKTSEGKALFSTYEKSGLLDNSGRRKLCQLIVRKELQDDPDKSIKSQRLLSLSQEIVEVFPKEHISTYFIPYMNYGLLMKKAAKGKLLDCFNNRRREYIKAGIIVATRRYPSKSEGSLLPYKTKDGTIKSEETSSLAAFLILPFLFFPVTTKRKKGKSTWRHSKIKARDGFITHLRSELRACNEHDFDYEVRVFVTTLTKRRVDGSTTYGYESATRDGALCSLDFNQTKFRKPQWKFRRTTTDLRNQIQNAEMQSIIQCIGCLIHIKRHNSFKPGEGQKERTYVRIACTSEIKVFMGVVKKWMVLACGKFDYKRRVIRITRNRYNF